MGNIQSYFEKRLSFLRGKPAETPRGESLSLKPIRNPLVRWEPVAPKDDDDEADQSDGAIHIIIPRSNDRFSRILTRIFRAQDTRRVELDVFGASIWNRCDGAHTVDDLIRVTCDLYKLNRRQCEVSVITFMRTLSQRRLVLFSTGVAEVHAQGKPVHTKSRRPRKQRAR